MRETGDVPVAVVSRTTSREVGERVEVAWRLDATPGLEWIEVFQLAEVDGRHGSVEWTDGGGPDVVGDTVRWFVATADLGEADAEVARRVAVANERCAATPGPRA